MEQSDYDSPWKDALDQSNQAPADLEFLCAAAPFQ
jgi:hypothetical protein